nr:hypothetical protein [Halomonas sp. UBA3074]
MPNEKYSLLKYDETKEYHLFKSYIGNEGKCLLEGKDPTPICGDNVVIADRSSALFVCRDEVSSRTKCAVKANEGIEICGRCVGSLYKTGSKVRR